MIIQNRRKKLLISIITIICFLMLTVFVNGAMNIQREDVGKKADTSFFNHLGYSYYICLPNSGVVVVNNYKLCISSVLPSDNNRIDLSQANMYSKRCKNINEANIYNSHEIVMCLNKKDGKK